MTEKEPTGKVEVAHISGIQGIRAAMEVLACETARGEEGAEWRAGKGETGVPLPGATPEDVPLGRRTCTVCAADNDGSRETCWNCGASLRRAR